MNLITSGHEGLRPLVGDLTKQCLVLRHTKLNRRYQTPRFQIFQATGGFGCKESSLGTHVFGIHLADGESATWHRKDFIGIASQELVNLAMEDDIPTIPINESQRIYFVVAKDGTIETGDTIEEARQRLKRITWSAIRVAYCAHPESRIANGVMTYPPGIPPREVTIKKRGGIWIDAS